MVRTQVAGAPRTTMPYTLAEAAAAVGMAKSSIRRAVQSGRISGTRDDLGVWHIEPVELHRVFPPVTSGAERSEGAPAALELHAPTPDAERTTDALVAELRTVIADLRRDRERDHGQWQEVVADLQRDRDEWRDQAKRLALSAPVPPPPPAAPTPAEPAVERERLAEVEAAAIPALRDTVAALKAALDAEQARNRDLRRARDAGGLLERAWRWARARG
jgi:hypothetical protein